MSEFMWLLWIFAAAIVAGAAITLVAYGAGIAAGVFVETYHAHRVRHRRAWVRRAIQRGERDVRRELDAPRRVQQLSALPPLPSTPASASRRRPEPMRGVQLRGLSIVREPEDEFAARVLRFQRGRDGLMAVADAPREERT